MGVGASQRRQVEHTVAPRRELVLVAFLPRCEVSPDSENRIAVHTSRSFHLEELVICVLASYIQLSDSSRDRQTQ